MTVTLPAFWNGVQALDVVVSVVYSRYVSFMCLSLGTRLCHKRGSLTWWVNVGQKRLPTGGCDAEHINYYWWQPLRNGISIQIHMCIENNTKKLFSNIANLQTNSCRIALPRSGPTCRVQVGNPRCQTSQWEGQTLRFDGVCCPMHDVTNTEYLRISSWKRKASGWLIVCLRNSRINLCQSREILAYWDIGFSFKPGGISWKATEKSGGTKFFSLFLPLRK